ncbi:hypothetical protein BCR42DRAFT_444630 [Absidia repens]|uniref:Uncharacterized protein n=1 Tax=Absidia repens TaxID=90262 RepID=A0A1X2HLM9_9FUNG|nr:hypothetical protein BCR42DRAFT_444630 [Absidia repens]
MKASSIPVNCNPTTARKLQPLIQYQPTTFEDSKVFPSSSELPITLSASVSEPAVCTPFAIQSNLPSTAAFSTEQVFDITPANTSFQQYLLPYDLSAVYIDPSQLAGSNDPMQVTDDYTRINHSYFGNNGILPLNFGQPLVPPQQHLTEQDFLLTSTLHQLDILHF